MTMLDSIICVGYDGLSKSRKVIAKILDLETLSDVGGVTPGSQVVSGLTLEVKKDVRPNSSDFPKLRRMV